MIVDVPSREDITQLVREQLTDLRQENLQRDGQLESVITEMQNMIGQNRETGLTLKEINEKVRKMEKDEMKERLGVEIATTISRVEKLEQSDRKPGKSAVPSAAAAPENAGKLG